MSRYQVRTPFDVVTITFHWTTLALVIALIATAWLHEGAHDGASAAALLQAHRSLGVAVWIITAARLTWRLTHARLPSFPVSMTLAHRLAVKANEYGLYFLLLLQPVTGLLHTLYRGKAFDIFLLRAPAVLPRDSDASHLFHMTHEWGAWALIALVSGHAFAALVHHFILGDDVLEMMAPALRRRRP